MLTWEDHAGAAADGQVIERGTAAVVAACPWAVDFVALVTVGPGVETYVDGSVRRGTVYCYRVYAFTAAAVSDYSNVAGVAVPRRRW